MRGSWLARMGPPPLGNRVRHAFKYPELLASILKIYLANWLDDLRILFEVINSGGALCPQKVKAFTWKWLTRFHRSSIGQWHTPNVYVHLWKMLELFTVPLGLLSEQELEFKSKVFRSDRDHHAQQRDPVGIWK